MIKIKELIKSEAKNFLKMGIFVGLLYFMLCCISYYFANKKTIGRDRISVVGISGEKVNSIDFFILGDSEAYTAFIPLEIWKKYGYTGYVLATSAQRINETKEILTTSLTNQNPKVVILETNEIFRKNKPRGTKDSAKSMFLDIYKYHDNWKYFVDENFQEYSGNEKGYVYSVKVKKAKVTDYMKQTEKREKVPEENLKCLEEIINICKERNIEFILFSTPSSKNWSYKRHNTLVDIAEKNNVTYIDLNLDDQIEMNWETDTQDEGDHLNYYGALKTTNRLGDYLKELNLLEDHRNDEFYSRWHSHYEKYMLKFNN